MRIHRTTGDSLRHQEFIVTQLTDTGEQPRDLTGHPVLVEIRTPDGAVVVAETSDGLVVTHASTGQVTYDFPHGEHALPAGVYYLYFVIYGTGGRAAKFDTFPTPPERIEVVIADR